MGGAEHQAGAVMRRVRATKRRGVGFWGAGREGAAHPTTLPPTTRTHTAGLSPSRPPGTAQAGGSAATAAATGARRSCPRWSRSPTRPGPKTPPAAVRLACGTSARVAPRGDWGAEEGGAQGAVAQLTWARPRAPQPASASGPRPLPAAPPPGPGPPRPHSCRAVRRPQPMETYPSVHEPPVLLPDLRAGLHCPVSSAPSPSRSPVTRACPGNSPRHPSCRLPPQPQSYRLGSP